MKKEEILRALEIRYVDLKFTISFTEDSKLPYHKVSALRGGMGQMLLRENCIRDRRCENCDFAAECLVRRMMYSKYEIQPFFATRGDSIGYVLRCDDHKESFQAGDYLTFHLLLYGKTIAYFSQYLQAFQMLGQMGLGKCHAKYRIVKVENENGEPVVADRTRMHLQNLGIRTIREYVKERYVQILQTKCENTMTFRTPVALKYQRELIKEFCSEAIFRSVLRRIYSFDCFEGIEMPLLKIEGEVPEIIRQESYLVKIPRYSSTMQSRMSLEGIGGQVLFEPLSEEYLLILLACEKLHIGKNTSFGFGEYQI